MTTLVFRGQILNLLSTASHRTRERVAWQPLCAIPKQLKWCVLWLCLYIITKIPTGSFNTNLHLLFFLFFRWLFLRRAPLALVSAGSSTNTASPRDHQFFRRVLKGLFPHKITSVIFLIFLIFCLLIFFWCTIVLNIIATALVRIQDTRSQDILSRENKSENYFSWCCCFNHMTAATYRPLVSVSNGRRAD